MQFRAKIALLWEKKLSYLKEWLRVKELEELDDKRMI